MDLETITTVTVTAAFIGGGCYGVKKSLPPFCSAYGKYFGYALGEGVHDGLVRGITKANTGNDLPEDFFETPTRLAERRSLNRQLWSSYTLLVGSSLAVCLGICSGVPASVYEILSSF